jgi:D-glycero-alpha-D-manno-heptose-7-phosphate kinase
MIITKTPYRVSLFGGGTDHPNWYNEFGGEVISATIDKYCYLTSRILPPFFEHRYRIAYSKIETVRNLDEIKHPAVREGIRKFANDLYLEIQHHGDLPARSGVGSSSAFAVGLIHSLQLLKNRKFTKDDLAREAIELEQVDLQENVGSQDQIACAYGGFNHISFKSNGEWNVTPIEISAERLGQIEERMVLIYSGVSRPSSDIQQTLVDNFKSKKLELLRTQELAKESIALIESNADLNLIGEMLDESWALKKSANPKSVSIELDDLKNLARKSGALGGKILGAGGGGFCLFWVSPERRQSFIEKMSSVLYVPTRISVEGSTCILDSSNNLDGL